MFSRILVIKLRNIGDVLLATPALRALREAFPRAHLAVLVNAGTEAMVTLHPAVDEVLVCPRDWKRLPWFRRVGRELEFARRIRQGRYDLVLNLTEGDRGAILAWLSGARTRIGLQSRRGFWWKRPLFTRCARVEPRAHMVEQNLALLRALGLTPRPGPPELYLAEEERAAVDRRLAEARVRPGELLVHVHPTSRWLFKCWRDEAVAEVIDLLQGTRGARVVVTSGPESRQMEKTRAILAHTRTRPLDLAGQLSLKELAALSARAHLFFGVDTAPMHIAAAMGTPVVALFGPSGEFNWGPWGPGHAVVTKPRACRPCGQAGCGGSRRSECLESLTVPEVMAVLDRKLAELERHEARAGGGRG
ncbi:MAG: putative lipopolysaccharide heptosyltransferase III [Deltaproteobacteria bacterium]|nr:putative lipopolysaccharide heptosyltransferase III [Deltaproteobacteria bacterium]